ncbi:hypothetical protein B0T11DRAFT_18469 [Plectosphaerella cucumerina]|uniref:Zn(2)-C6 fungal-type domain-containing protein n=1 Tax=Plectosphaerella cucumerina TaxID=40658 RepID=A0A8K0TVS4_9PEZI|nr:hypothetical protein B0T11DRAFT_18469 [Plectosphaerella cucumerina]
MSSFTALNGGSPKASEAPSAPAPEPKKPASDDRSHPPPPPPSLPPISEPRPAPVEPPSQRDTWSSSGIDRPHYRTGGSYADTETDASHKRKRSDSAELRRDREQTQPVQERTPDTATQAHPPEPRDRYDTPQRDRERRPYSEDMSRSHGDSWYSRDGRNDRGYYDQQHSASSAHGQTEEQISESLRRAADQADNQSDYGNTSPDADDRSMGMYGPYTPGGSRDPVLHSDPKKRKRNFSNRTKTGCLTCRKRKKKCDEQKPECRCLTGTFSEGETTLTVGQAAIASVAVSCALATRHSVARDGRSRKTRSRRSRWSPRIPATSRRAPMACRSRARTALSPSRLPRGEILCPHTPGDSRCESTRLRVAR